MCGQKERNSDEQYCSSPILLGAIFDQKSIKIPIKQLSKKRSPTNMEFDANGVPQWNQIDAKTHQTIKAKTGNVKDHQTHQNHVSLNGKIIEIHCKTSVFDGLADCVRETHQKLCQNPSQNR